MYEEYNFTVNKIDYTIEVVNGSFEIYETDNPSKTGFVIDGTKNLNLFINRFTDIVETLGEKNEVAGIV